MTISAFFSVAFRSILGESAFMFVHNSSVRIIKSTRLLYSERFGSHRVVEIVAQ